MTDAIFWDIAKEEAQLEVDQVVDKQLERVDVWVAAREAKGLPATLYDLIAQVYSEPTERAPILATLCGALWRLREMRDVRHQHGED